MCKTLIYESNGKHGKNIQCQPCEFLNLLISPLYGKHLSLSSFMAANSVSYYSILAYSCSTFEHFLLKFDYSAKCL